MTDPLKFLLVGRPGVGKTTVAWRLAAVLRDAGVPLRGFLTQEIREGARRSGFSIETLGGDRGVLAHVDFPGPPRVGRYGVNLAALEQLAIPALAAPEEHGVAIIDELGKMELASEAFRDAVLALFQRRVPVVATAQVARHPFTDALKRRLQLETVQVTQQNRDDLPEELAARVMAPQESFGSKSLRS